MIRHDEFSDDISHDFSKFFYRFRLDMEPLNVAFRTENSRFLIPYCLHGKYALFIHHLPPDFFSPFAYLETSINDITDNLLYNK